MFDDTNTPLEFPCDFPVKVMGSDTDGFAAEITGIIARHLPPESTGSIQHRPSRNGRYVSLTVEVRVESRQQLDAIYRDLHASEWVLMTL